MQIIHGVLHASLNQALKWGLIGRNCADAVDRPRTSKKEMLVLGPDQVRILLEAVQSTRWEALFWVAVTTGLRQGELLGLKWSDLKWSTRRLTIQRQLQRIDHEGIVFREPKTTAGKRVVVLGAAVERIL